MTNLDAIKAKVNYPLPDNSFKVALEERGLVSENTYIPLTDKVLMDLAKADVLYTLVSEASVSEGGYSISVGDKATLKAVADGIYDKYGETRPNSPTATFESIM